MKRLLWFFVGSFLTSSAVAQVVGPVQAPNFGSVPYTASGGTTGRTLSARSADVKNAGDYGAKCDGSTDDSAAINAAVSAIRNNTAVGGNGSWPIGHANILRLPQGRCVINSSLNFTGLYGSGFVADLWGSTIICQTSGTPCIDATGSGQMQLNGLNIYASQTNSPNIGLSIGRITNNGVGADHVVMEHPTLTGYFTLAGFFNNQSETTIINAMWITNWAANAYGAIFDGSNHFNIQSAFTGQTYPANTYYSFNENTCVECIIGTFGDSSVPLWIGGTARHRFSNSYVYYSNSTANKPGPAVQLYFGTNSGSPLVNDFLDLDIHFEDFGTQHNLTSLVQISGAASSVTVHGLHIRDNFPEQSGPLFTRSGSVTSITIENANLEIGHLAGVSPSWWDLPSAYTVSGKVYNQDGTFAPPGAFTGETCLTSSCAHSVALPPSLAVSTLVSGGSVASVTVGGSNNYGYGVAVPSSCIFAPPSGGGQQAGCTVNYLSINGYGFLDGTHGSAVGTGYTVGDTLTCSGGTLATGGTPLQVQVDTIGAGGSVATWHGVGFSTTKYTATPAEPCSLTGGTGAGAILAAGSWKVLAAAVTLTPGAGYTSAPAAVLSAPTCANGPCGTSFPATLTGVLSTNAHMNVSAGGAQTVLDGGLGAVQTLTQTGSNNFGYGTSIPSCSMTAPPAGGTQATCAVDYFMVNGYGFLDGTNGSAVGSGYTVNDVLTCAGGTQAGGNALTVKVSSVDGTGAITGWFGPFATTSITYTATPHEPCTLTGGTGTGAILAAGSWKIHTVSITNAGAGYTTTPTVTLGTPACPSGPCGSSFAPTLTATLDGTVTLSAGAGQALLDSTGTKLGVAGATGSPVLMVGALIDNSGVRQSLGSTYTVPQNTSLVRFVQGTTVAASTVTLPTAIADGQSVQFVNYAGAITALTFSPAVAGWTNGSTLSANTGLRIRWDATAAAWQREQ